MFLSTVWREFIWFWDHHLWVLSRFISNALLSRPRRQSGFRRKKQQLWVDWQRTPFWERFSIQPRLRGKNAELCIFFYSITDIYSGTSSWLYVGHGSWSLKNSLQGNIILPPYGLHNCLFRFLFVTGVRKSEPRLRLTLRMGGHSELCRWRIDKSLKHTVSRMTVVVRCTLP